MVFAGCYKLLDYCRYGHNEAFWNLMKTCRKKYHTYIFLISSSFNLMTANQQEKGLDYSRYRTKLKILFVIIYGEQVSEGNFELYIKVARLASEFIAFQSSVVQLICTDYCSWPKSLPRVKRLTHRLSIWQESILV